MKTYDHPFDALDEWDQKTDSEIEKIVSKKTIAILREAVDLLVNVDGESYSDVEPSTFVATVREMRSRKKIGSHALGQAILDASDWLEQGRIDEAREVYEAFLKECKFRFYRDIAIGNLRKLK